MTSQPVFSQRVLIGWVAAAVIIFAASLYFMGGGQLGDPESVGPSTYSRSAIGHAGIAAVLQRQDIPVVKSQSNSLGQLKRGSVLVIAEPRTGNEEIIRTLLKADTILIVLPKWSGVRNEKKSEWLREVKERSVSDAMDPQTRRAARRSGTAKHAGHMDHKSTRACAQRRRADPTYPR